MIITNYTLNNNQSLTQCNGYNVCCCGLDILGESKYYISRIDNFTP